MHQDLYAPFDIPLLKTSEELRMERDSVLRDTRLTTMCGKAQTLFLWLSLIKPFGSNGPSGLRLNGIL
jgi:hypothetical protein